MRRIKTRFLCRRSPGPTTPTTIRRQPKAKVVTLRLGVAAPARRDSADVQPVQRRVDGARCALSTPSSSSYCRLWRPVDTHGLQFRSSTGHAFDAVLDAQNPYHVTGP
ncbi:hypothetical protein HPB47_000542 [Ixodes persulcatus]|uniref:Uncharacterized protein n=1 Tax=Ixodes persulcatus TaxID=34615 RepID=A0AC60PS75_IXOPE|nr:hypothetical protein HPB47_000542 [Ixodes persulcatus]